MRDTYYQSVGNPVQYDRLPATRPTLQLLPPSVPLAQRWSNLIFWLFWTVVLSSVAMIAYQPPGFRWLEPFDLLLAWPTLFAAIGMMFWRGSIRVLLHPGVLLAALVVFVNHRTPWECQILLASGLLGLLTYCYGIHWGHVATTLPVSHNLALMNREKWHADLNGTAMFVSVLTGVTLWTSWPPLLWCLAATPLFLLFAKRPDGVKRPVWKTVRTSVLSWFNHEPAPLPGLPPSPVGSAGQRAVLGMVCGIILTMAFARTEYRPATVLLQFLSGLDGSGSFSELSISLVKVTILGLGMASIPLLFSYGIAIPSTLHVLLEGELVARQSRSRTVTQAAIEEVSLSPDPVEQTSLYLGRIVADGSPVLVPRKVFEEHAHGLGDSGSGKTSLFLSPLIEQLVRTGPCSVIVVDLKADSLELLATLQSCQEFMRREKNIEMPLKYFSNQVGKSTYAFNPLTQPFWNDFDLLTRTDITCGASGLTYGTDYGAGYYSSANAAILYHAFKTFPNVKTFSELADCIGQVLTKAKRNELHPEIRKAGVHVHEVIKRLKACQSLNVTSDTGHDSDVVEQAIDLTKVFEEPQLLYFHLSATLSPSGAPEIARLVNYMLLAAATKAERKHPVFLVIDEFQRMVANNLEYMLQLARSMGVGVILANQSMEDLKKTQTNLIPAIEANCRLRQWFSVSSSDDQKRLIDASGQTVDLSRSWSESVGGDGRRTVSYSEAEQVVNRFSLNDVLLTSDHPFRSILRISRGAGYAQYGGLPCIIESQFHISEAEYQRRRATPWPNDVGTFVPRLDNTSSAPVRTGPIITEEISVEPVSEVMGTEQERAIAEMFRAMTDELRHPERENDKKRKKPN